MLIVVEHESPEKSYRKISHEREKVILEIREMGSIASGHRIFAGLTAYLIPKEPSLQLFEL